MRTRLTEHLKRRCQALSVEDRAALAGMMIQSLDREPVMDVAERLEEMRQKILEEYKVDVLDRCRMQPGPYLRAVFSHLALERLPISQSDMARYLGIKPCSVNYYERMVRDALNTPVSNPPLIGIYQNLIQTI